jgi:hypothetical protein
MTPVRLPSLDAIATESLRTARRFPEVLAASGAALVIMIRLIGASGDLPAWEGAMAAATLGLPLTLALALGAEGRGWRWDTAPLLRGMGVALAGAVLVAWAWSWPGWTATGRATRFALLTTAFHLAASVAAFPGAHQGNAFWQAVRVVLQRVVTTAVFAAALFAGLGAALGALDLLFGMDVPPAAYGRLWALVTFGFGTGFFLAGIPNPPDALAASRDYPTGLRKFAQFVLVPLVAVYLAILTAYLAKVLLTRQWPSGWIGNLVSAVAIAGMLAWMLLHPLEDDPAHRWVRPVTRGYFAAMLPSIAMLWVALGKRVAQYGLTSRRVIALAGALWLSAITLHYLVTRARGIRPIGIRRIPATLALLAAVLAVGPLSAIALTVRDQRGRAEAVLRRHAMVREGRWVPAPAAGVGGDAPALASAVRAMAQAGGGAAFVGLIPDSVQHPPGADTSGVMRREVGTRVLRYLGGDALADEVGFRRPVTEVTGVRTVVLDQQSPVAVDGFAWASRGSLSPDAVPVSVAPGYRLRVAADSQALELRRATTDSALVLRLPLDGAFRDAVSTPDPQALEVAGQRALPPRPRLVVEGRTPGVRLRVLVEQLTVDWRGTTGRLRYLEGPLLLALDSLPPSPR